MPMYEFACQDCGYVFEIITGADSPAPACAKCGSHNTARQISAPSPLKKGAFPFKPGPVHPMAHKMGMGGGPACGTCNRGGN